MLVFHQSVPLQIAWSHRLFQAAPRNGRNVAWICFGASQTGKAPGQRRNGTGVASCRDLISFSLSEDSKIRIDTMVKVSDGFKLAEVDLKLRGPGDMMGTKQSGILKFKLADIVYDTEILNNARKCAYALLESDSRLINKENIFLCT